MKPTANWSLRIVDAVGGSVVIAALATFIWFALLRTDHTSDEVRRLRAQLLSARQSVRDLRSECDRQRSSLAAYRVELDETGELPVHARVEEYFRTLGSLAARNQLRVMRQNPLASRTYPGLLERRFAYQVTGATADLTQFLKEIEQTEFWADVAYLRIEGAFGGSGRPAGSNRDSDNQCLLRRAGGTTGTGVNRVTVRQKKTYLTVIGVGLGALAVDRWLLRKGPATAEAFTHVPLAAAGPVVPSALSDRDPSIPEVPFPRMLHEMGAVLPLRDVFARKAPSGGPTSPSPDNAEPSDKASLRGTFAASHKLEALLQQDGLKIAVVNGRWMKPGDSLDGCRLVTVSGTQARFECADGQTELDLRIIAPEP